MKVKPFCTKQKWLHPDLGSPQEVALSLSRQTVLRPLPAAESLGLMVVDLHWPVQGHVQHVKHGTVPDSTLANLITLWSAQHVKIFNRAQYKTVHSLSWLHHVMIIIIIYPLTTRVNGAPQMISQPVSSIFFPVLHCPLELGELQACPFSEEGWGVGGSGGYTMSSTSNMTWYLTAYSSSWLHHVHLIKHSMVTWQHIN